MIQTQLKEKHFQILEQAMMDDFKSLIGSPLGDAASALFFIIYLAVTLKNAKNNNKKKYIGNNSLLPNHLSDHGYEPTKNIVFTLNQQYADDISWASTSKTVLEKNRNHHP